MIASNLKRCPFCGGERIDLYQSIGGYYQTHCCGCTAGIPRGFSKKEDAIAAWNRRAEEGEK